MPGSHRLFGFAPSAGAADAGALLAVLDARLPTKPLAERRIAVVFAADAAEAAATLVAALRGAGYRTGGFPADGAELAAVLPGGAAAEPESLSFATYSAFVAALPAAIGQSAVRRWGPAERDPAFRPGRLDCGSFVIPGWRSGNVAALLRPADDGEAAPTHAHLAGCAWLADDFRADAAIEPTGDGRFACLARI